MSTPERKRFTPEELARQSEALARAAESGGSPQLFRDDADTWWALDAAGSWQRHSGSKWEAGGPPAGPVEGPALERGPSTPELTEASTHEDLEARVAEVADLYRRGEVTSGQAEDMLASLCVVDANGREWTVGVKSKDWFAFDGTRWVDMPIKPEITGRAARTPSPEPVAGEWTPPPPPGTPQPPSEPVRTGLAPEPDMTADPEPVPAATPTPITAPPAPVAAPPVQAPPAPAPPPPAPSPSAQTPASAPAGRLRSYGPEEVAVVAGAIAHIVAPNEPPHMFRDDEGRWWAFDGAGREWYRHDAGTWSLGRAPRATLVGEPVPGFDGGKPAEEVVWDPPDPPIPAVQLHKEAAAEVRASAPEHEPTLEPAPEKKKKGPKPFRLKRRRWGPGMAMLIGGGILIAAAFIPWVRGSLIETDATKIPLQYALEGGQDVHGAGFTMATFLIICGAVAAALSWVRGADWPARAAGLAALIITAMFVSRVAGTLDRLNSLDFAAEDLFDVIAPGPFVALIGAFLIVVGRTGRRPL